MYYDLNVIYINQLAELKRTIFFLAERKLGQARLDGVA